jgi:hypothetical protein
MVNLRFVEYDEKHHTEYYRIFHDYLKWHNEQVVKHYGVHFFKNGNINKALERIVPIYTAIKPPEGVILLLTIENKVLGMGRLARAHSFCFNNRIHSFSMGARSCVLSQCFFC